MNNYDTIDLADGTQWFILKELPYNNNTYYLVIETNDNDDFFPEQAKVLKEVIKDGKTYFSNVKNEDLLNTLIPLLVPESKQFIDNPEQLKQILQKQLDEIENN